MNGFLSDQILFTKMIQSWSFLIKNDQNGQKWPKMVKNGQNGQK